MSNLESGPQGLSRRPYSSSATTTFSTEVFDYEVVPSSLASIAPILRVANEIEHERPRVSYHCRLYGIERAHRLDPGSTGRGVRQFKTLLLQRLERDNATSLAKRIKKTDWREIESVYQQYYEHYVHYHIGEQADRAQLAKAYQTAGVLFEVRRAVNKSEKVKEVAPEIIAAIRDVQERRKFMYLITFFQSFFEFCWGLQLDEALGMWESVRALARGYEYIMGLVLFTPVAVLAWFPFVSEFQTPVAVQPSFQQVGRSISNCNMSESPYLLRYIPYSFTESLFN